ncbi:GspE/PulE family protein [Clostridium aestuarii]|uniref:GspE/PulE family protein n=1 Tax=Clostridium aestuarii TaxID=338193 RepID=A0ABT4D014_9CLOT|nr:GspE/PulE family protein [Clostridium aestuarii]MCY6484579.1 GspE/PulE family protein [Clostridium aestuarii]
MGRLNKKRLGDLLVQAGKITKKQLQVELEKQREKGIKLGELLIKDKILSEEDIIDALKVQLDLERVHLDMINVDRETVKAIPESLAKKYLLIGFSFEGNKIKVAMSDPLNLFAVDDVHIATGKEVIPVIDTKGNIENAIDRYYSSEYVEKAAKELSISSTKIEIKEEVEELDEVKNAPVVKLIDSIIKNSVKSKASDIHIEPFADYIKIRYRIDGMLKEVLRVSKDTIGSLITRIKILSNLDISEKRIPQDGRIITKVDNEDVDLRISVLPTVYGEKVVIRVLKKNNFLVKKDKLGMDEAQVKEIEKMIKSPYGIILVTGPTGSGKTTTLYTMLEEINKPENNIITIEDPVEYRMEGINQVNVNNKAGLTFAAGLRSMLRQDPDIIMIGEIRDQETAEIAIRAAITGHLVLSTIHTNDAASAVARLRDMGIEPYLISAAMTGVIAQRLVRKICPKCIEEYYATEYEKRILGMDKFQDIKLYKGKGCTSCGNTGYMGRIGTYEIMEVTKSHKEIIQINCNSEEIRKLNLKNEIKTLEEACKKLVLQGVTTIDELAKITFIKE